MWFSLALISNYILLRYVRIQIIILIIFCICWDFLYDPGWDLFWRKYHRLLRKMCNLLQYDGLLYKYLLSSFLFIILYILGYLDLIFTWRFGLLMRVECWDLPLLLYLYLSVPSCSKVFCYELEALIFSAYTFRIISSCLFDPFIICIGELYCFNCFLHKTCFVWYENRYHCLLWISICLVWFFLTFHV
jgi:hypothetical protein